MKMSEKQDKTKQMESAFDASTEESLYKLWEESGFFTPENVEKYLKENGNEIKKPFTITLPPPNANGQLHLGHTCGYSFQDAMGRFNRMMGHPTLLLPGKDHASIQTEAVFSRILEEQGENKWDLGRDEFYKRCYEFCMSAAKNAQEQEKRIGLSADWSRDFFTLDPRLNEIINETFFEMFKDGLIYRGKYIINQCPHCRTALADIDTERKEMPGIFAYIVYPFTDEKDNDLAEKKLGQRGIMIATTRPETMLADTAVAVNPDDDRYKEFVGKKVMLPVANREIPIIADEAVDIENGTGALKVTPAHSPIDFDIGLTHNLDVINVIDENGHMTGEIPERFKGMETIECSKALVKELEEMGLLNKIERIKHEVTVCERCQTPIEPIVSYQWFVDVKPLAEKALEAIRTGKTIVIPDGQQSALIHFFENIKPWCISRQLWWGQRIPVWYSGGKKLYDWLQDNPESTIEDWEEETGDKAKGSGKIIASLDKPENDPEWKGSSMDLWLEEESDIFDTWFSSGQWPFSTLGGREGEDFKKYYPTQVMETARDILFWWVARMMMLGIYKTGETPFARVFLHGLILAADGSKMSKSRNNGVAPAEVFKKYGADALRLWYFTDSLPGSNTLLQEEKIKGNRFFINKIWNASRFILLNLEESEIPALRSRLEAIDNGWKNGDLSASEILMKTKEHTEKIIEYMDQLRFHLAAESIREFFWKYFCDICIEDTKNEIKGKEIGSDERIESLAILLYVLKQNLKIMHPLIPYITEAVWQELTKAGLAEGFIMVQQIG
ncbi:valine--tRNA ligase [Candidatus Nomurabacteria bacterium]|nr:valine--tRNA ligase [Candidatus Nomurabacteria bacterium]